MNFLAYRYSIVAPIIAGYMDRSRGRRHKCNDPDLLGPNNVDHELANFVFLSTMTTPVPCTCIPQPRRGLQHRPHQDGEHRMLFIK